MAKTVADGPPIFVVTHNPPTSWRLGPRFSFGARAVAFRPEPGVEPLVMRRVDVRVSSNATHLTYEIANG